MYNVVKRDGKIASFDLKKISDAITQAFDACNKQYNANIIDFLALKVTAEFEPKIEDETISVENITFSYEGETWKIYSGNISVEDITWSTGNSAVATIEKGVVTAVGNGKTTVYGKYGEMEVSCIIRCSFAPKESGIGGSDFITEDG